MPNPNDTESIKLREILSEDWVSKKTNESTQKQTSKGAKIKLTIYIYIYVDIYIYIM